MDLSGLLSVDEASERLGRSPQAVRLMASSGQLDAVKRGNAWWLDARAVERRRRGSPGSGRPLSPAMAWSVLLLASGSEGPLPAKSAHHSSRARRWLRDHPLAEHYPRLRSRSRSERFDAHPAETGRILARPDVMATGVSAAAEVGVHGTADAAEFYAPDGARAILIDEHALEEGDGRVLVRWVPDELWPAVSRPRALRAAVLVDLLEHDDPRARREAARALEGP
jgi:hypothetical protein